MSKRSLRFVIAAATLAVAVPAWAHPKLTASAPDANATLAAAPSEIRLSFNEALEAAMSGAEVQDQSGNKVEAGKASTDAKDKKQLVVPLATTLKPGIYTVSWHVVAADTHRVKGTYTFTVGP